jgi:hypothetical protein
MDFLNAVDEEIRRITDECYAEARRLLRENRARLDAIVPELLAHESLDESEIYASAGIERRAATSSPAPVRVVVEGILRRSFCGPSRWLASDARAS